MDRKTPRCTACQTNQQRRGLYGFCHRCWRGLPETVKQRLQAARYKHSQGRFRRPER